MLPVLSVSSPVHHRFSASVELEVSGSRLGLIVFLKVLNSGCDIMVVLSLHPFQKIHSLVPISLVRLEPSAMGLSSTYVCNVCGEKLVSPSFSLNVDKIFLVPSCLFCVYVE